MQGHDNVLSRRRPCGGRRRVCRAWPGFETTRRAQLAARATSGRAGHAAPGTKPTPRGNQESRLSGAALWDRDPATALGHRRQASLAPCVAPAHRWSSRWTCEPVGERASIQLVVGQNVPGRGTSGYVSDKIPPARPKAWNLGCFARAGRVFPVLGADRLRRESFVPGLVWREEGRTKCVSSLPDWRPGTACEIGGEVSDQLWRGSWASSRRSWADLAPRSNTHPDR